jgi:two-component system chemotaxis response regulator CheB
VAGPIRVMIVDDSVVVRGHIRHWIESEPGLAVVASVRDGHDAVDQVAGADPDVVVLDIEMPGLDGVSALPLLLGKSPDVAVIIASSLTRHNAEIAGLPSEKWSSLMYGFRADGGLRNGTQTQG